MQHVNTALRREVEQLIKLETVLEPSSEANDDTKVKQGFPSEKTMKDEYFEE